MQVFAAFGAVELTPATLCKCMDRRGMEAAFQRRDGWIIFLMKFTSPLAGEVDARSAAGEGVDPRLLPPAPLPSMLRMADLSRKGRGGSGPWCT